MILDLETFNVVSFKSRTRILCVCDDCGKQNNISRFNIKDTYRFCNSCTAKYNGRKSSVHSKDENFFSIPNTINSYWAGFIAADGCLSHPSKHSYNISFGIYHSDGHHLNKFVEQCAFTGSVRINEENRKARLDITSEQWGIDLQKNFNITERKSLTLSPPTKLPFELAMSFLVGFIDGDGCISIYSKKYPSIILQLIGTVEIMRWAMSIFEGMGYDREGNEYIYRHARDSKVYKCKITGRKALPILRKLKNINVPKLDRKWSKVN